MVGSDLPCLPCRHLKENAMSVGTMDAYVIDPVVGKALGIVGHAERGQPLRGRGHLLPSRFRSGICHNDHAEQL